MPKKPEQASSAMLDEVEHSRLISGRLITRQELPQLLEEFRPLLKNIAEREVPAYLSARFDSSDVVQETLLKAHHQFSQFHGSTEEQFAAWMRGILLNQIVDTIRYHGRRIRDMARDRSMPTGLECGKSLTASDFVQRQESRERLQAALRKMPEDYRLVLTLRQEHDLSFADIGKQMNRSGDAARMLWGRAILLLAKIMQAERSEA